MAVEVVRTTLPGRANMIGIIDGNFIAESNETASISGGAITADRGGFIVVSAETGTEDTITEISGDINGEITFMAAGGHSITFAKSAYLKMPLNYTLTGYKIIKFRHIGEGIWLEISRSPNT